MWQLNYRQFVRVWRYAMEKELITPSGQPFELAPENLHFWGDEPLKIDVGTPPDAATVSSNGERLAITSGEKIYVYPTHDLAAKPQVLWGHTAKVDDCAFQPGNANVLVSASTYNYNAPDREYEPTIIIWRLRERAELVEVLDEQRDQLTREMAQQLSRSLSAIHQSLALDDRQQEQARTMLAPVVNKISTFAMAAPVHKFHGKLLGNTFQSNNFSPSGRWLVYLPGKRIEANYKVPWDIRIHDMQDHRDVATLIGHTDSITWAGFSPDDKWFGSVAWDQTMRLWDTSDWSCKHTIKTDSQNWTGAFSPDSKMFAGTCGDGSLHVHSLETFSEVCRLNFTGWWRCLAWHPDCTRLAVGGSRGKLNLVDVRARKLLGERIMGAASNDDDDDEKPSYQDRIRGYVETYRVCFMDGGNKLLVLTRGDGSVEVYDFGTAQKHRFAPRRTHDPRSQGTEDGDLSSALQEDEYHRRFCLTTWEDTVDQCIKIVSVDGNSGVGIRSMPMA